MSTNKKVDDAMRTVAEWVAAHDFAPETIEGTVQIVLDHLKKQNREITISSMNAALAEVKMMIRAQMQDKAPEPEDAEVEVYRKQIAGWSSAEMREFCKDPAVLAAVESVLSTPRKEVSKVEPQPQPKSDPLLAEIEKMSADELKRQLAKSPARAAGIEAVLSRRGQ